MAEETFTSPLAANTASAHDQWFHGQVSQGIAEADSPKAKWLSSDEVHLSLAQKRAQLSKLLTGEPA